MNNFTIQIVEDQKYNLIIFADTYESPFYHIDEIEKEINDMNIQETVVLFDRLLSIGNVTERFVELKFRDGRFIKDSYKTVSLLKKSKLRTRCANYFHDHDDLLEYSILTNIQKKLLKKGITI